MCVCYDSLMTGRQLLARYLTANGLTQTDFAMRCAVDPSAVSFWLDGSRCPRREQRARIEMLTASEVSRFSWLSDTEAGREKAREEWLEKTAMPVPFQALAARGWKP